MAVQCKPSTVFCCLNTGTVDSNPTSYIQVCMHFFSVLPYVSRGFAVGQYFSRGSYQMSTNKVHKPKNLYALGCIGHSDTVIKRWYLNDRYDYYRLEVLNMCTFGSIAFESRH